MTTPFGPGQGTLPSAPAMVRDAVGRWTATLTAAGIDDARVDAALLVAHVLGVARNRLALLGERPLSDAETARLAALGARRAGREPLQYLLGEWPFLDLILAVGPGALIPRPETEEWVDHLLHGLIPRHFADGEPRRFADIGTGTGAIGLALGLALPECLGFLVDNSAAALGLARRNLGRHPGLRERLALVRGDLTLPLRDGSFDLVVANPPYVDTADLAGLQPEVRDHEPLAALDGGHAGIEVIARLLADVVRVLRPRGLFVMEHGHGQRVAIRSLPHPGLEPVEERNDAAGWERCCAWMRR